MTRHVTRALGLVAALAAGGAIPLLAIAQEEAVPVYHEPHHRMVFQSGFTRILDVQVPPGDTSLFHSHDSPILYVTLSASTLKTQLPGQDWSVPGRGGRGGGANAGSPSSQGARISSTTSYVQQPVTHRISNVGDRLFHLVAVINESKGNDASTPTDAGFSGAPELTNRWFRAYRFSLAPGESTARHRHTTPAVLVATTDGRAVAAGPMTWELNEAGRWAWFDAGVPHDIRNAGDARIELVEVEVR